MGTIREGTPLTPFSQTNDLTLNIMTPKLEQQEKFIPTPNQRAFKNYNNKFGKTSNNWEQKYGSQLDDVLHDNRKLKQPSVNTLLFH